MCLIKETLKRTNWEGTMALTFIIRLFLCIFYSLFIVSANETLLRRVYFFFHCYSFFILLMPSHYRNRWRYAPADHFFSICMLGLWAAFIMNDNGIKLLLYNLQMDKIGCKLVEWNFKPHNVWYIDIWFILDQGIKNCMVLFHLCDQSQTRFSRFQCKPLFREF